MDTIDLDALPDSTKAALLPFAANFGRRMTLTFHLENSRPSDPMKAGLDQAVELGIISVEPFNDFGGLVYRPQRDFQPLLAWAMANEDRLGKEGDLHIPITQPFTSTDERVRWMLPFGQGAYGRELQGKKPRDNPYPAGTTDHKNWIRGYRAAASAR